MASDSPSSRSIVARDLLELGGLLLRDRSRAPASRSTRRRPSGARGSALLRNSSSIEPSQRIAWRTRMGRCASTMLRRDLRDDLLVAAPWTGGRQRRDRRMRVLVSASASRGRGHRRALGLRRGLRLGRRRRDAAERAVLLGLLVFSALSAFSRSCRPCPGRARSCRATSRRCARLCLRGGTRSAINPYFPLRRVQYPAICKSKSEGGPSRSGSLDCARAASRAKPRQCASPRSTSIR